MRRLRADNLAGSLTPEEVAAALEAMKVGDDIGGEETPKREKFIEKKKIPIYEDIPRQDEDDDDTLTWVSVIIKLTRVCKQIYWCEQKVIGCTSK